MGYYAIYAYENMYGGLHGINDYAVVEADSYEMAEKFAAELETQIKNYPCQWFNFFEFF